MNLRSMPDFTNTKPRALMNRLHFINSGPNNYNPDHQLNFYSFLEKHRISPLRSESSLQNLDLF